MKPDQPRGVVAGAPCSRAWASGFNRVERCADLGDTEEPDCYDSLDFLSFVELVIEKTSRSRDSGLGGCTRSS
jgi:hypothetical protein